MGGGYFGYVLLRRAVITTQQPAVAILAGCILMVLLLAGDHGLLNVNRPAWLGLVVQRGSATRFGRDSKGSGRKFVKDATQAD